MLNYQHNISLAPYNTFGLDTKANALIVIDSEAHLVDILSELEDKNVFILGGGSNILLREHVKVPVLKNEIRGKEIIQREANTAILRAGAGENWHELVCWSLEQGLGGLENLSLIPGTVGAAPIQNIGAYGVELKDVFYELEAIELASAKKCTFKAEECSFGYRDSVFKNALKGLYFITHVSFRLTTSKHFINTSYGAIQTVLAEKKINNPGPKDISEAVIEIRTSKLPDPAQIGNSGSFFKNPIISAEHFKQIENNYPSAPHYPLADGQVKVPAGWLIERCGWKGKRIGDAGTYHKQALVIVNHGNATGQEIWDLAQQIIEDVEKEFSIRLQAEVNVI
ncbi:MAG: UDP-N-acetylmuramate dehydrogenase [Chitinophagales bacterium]|nr:UDP-N-acetylmuramate dehydrogenase [Chitinophagales bacterium]